MSSFKELPPTVEEVKHWESMGRLVNPRNGKDTIKGKSSYKYLNKYYKKYKEDGLLDKKVHTREIMDEIDITTLKEEHDKYAKEREKKIENDLTNKTLYVDKDGKPLEFNKETEVDYISLRNSRMCPISFNTKLNESNAFPFYDMWDPYSNGDRCGKDPHGPLWFDACCLAYDIWRRRLNGLWINGDMEYSGTYGENVGIGENFFLHGRGHFPEKHLFRLPVPNLYLPKDYHQQHPVVSPLLTNQEIVKINDLVKANKIEYIKLFKRNPPNLIKIKENYDIAIQKEPKISMLLKDKKEEDLTSEELQMFRYKANQLAVENLKRL